MKKVKKINDEMLRAAPELCFIEDMFSAGGVVIRCNLLVLIGGLMYSTCVRSVMLHTAKTYAMTVPTLNPRIDSVMSMQRMKLVQTPFSQNLASTTCMLCFAPVGLGD